MIRVEIDDQVLEVEAKDHAGLQAALSKAQGWANAQLTTVIEGSEGADVPAKKGLRSQAH
jgi:hypothetical protein